MSAVWTLTAVVCVALALTLKPVARFALLMGLALIAFGFFTSTSGRTTFEVTTSYIVAALLGLLLIARRGRFAFPLEFLPLLAYLLLGVFFAWSGGGTPLATSLNFLVFLLAWMSGQYLGELFRDHPGAERYLVIMIALLLGFEAVIAVGQTFGAGWFPLGGRTADLEGGRSNGTFPHPATLGKVATLLLVLVLPSTQSSDRSTRHLAAVAVVAAIAATGASVSRTNIISIILMVLVWAVLQPWGRPLLNRMGMPLLVGGVSLFFIGDVLSRIEETNDDARTHFLEVASQQFAMTPWLGVGPGQYVLYVGAFDPLTAEGWPVHNIFVLAAVELGIIGVVLFFAPFAWVFFHALKHLKGQTRQSDFSRSTLAYLPAFIFIGSTGWGLLNPDSAVLLFFVVGFAGTQIRSGLRQHSPEFAPLRARPVTGNTRRG